MGRELIGTSTAFTTALQRAERCLQNLGAEWSLLEELTRVETESRVNEPTLSMALTTSIQLGLVELLRAWGIQPAAVTGHSSGEAAAAYAARAIGFESAVAVSYYRGLLTQKYQKQMNLQGAMLAAGLGPDEALPYLDGLYCGRAVVACINSPSSVTISGDYEAIAEVEERLAAGGIFARQLKVRAAYHSHHMLPQVDDYLALLSAKFDSTPETFGDVRFSSPVSGKTVWSAGQLGPQHWVDNMTKPVLFAQSLSNMCYGQLQPSDLEQQQLVDLIIEVGPHSALAGPIRQILNQAHLKACGISYTSCLERNKNAITTMHNVACTLIMQGCPVSLMEINSLVDQKLPNVLHDLPSYPWNHSKSYWKEPRLNKVHRLRQHAPHDLLGSKVLGGNDASPVWRHLITPSGLPWIRDHVVQSEIVYPGAGFISMAIEAYEQMSPSSREDNHIYQLANISLKAALVIPDAPDGIEVQLRFHKRDQRFLDCDSWWEFAVDSVDPSGKWQHHCSGSIARQAERHHTSFVNVQRVVQESQNVVSIDRFYDSFQNLGIEYGPLFRNLSSVTFGDGTAKCEMRTADTATTMPLRFESAHIIHPSTIDALFQAMYATLPNAGQELDMAMIPTQIGSLIVRPYLQKRSGAQIRITASRNRMTRQSFDASLVAFTDGDVPAVEIDYLHCQAIGASLRKTNLARQTGICSTVHWREDFTLSDSDRYASMLLMPPDEAELRIIADAKRASFHLIHDALIALSPNDIENLEWYHKAFHNWMLYQVELAKADKLAPRSSKWLKTSAGVKEMLIEKVAASSVSGEMVVRIGKNLLPILRKKTVPLQLMLDGKLLYAYYEKALRTSRSYAQIQQLVQLIGHKMPRANILEVGGGTAGCTVPVLKALRVAANNANPGFQHYMFTDVSSGFFEMAREKLAEWGSMITYRPLDIEQSPEEQGFVPGTYDIIVACQVLHATKSMTKTMTNVRSLLRPGGKLLMVETTKDALDVQIIFGTLPGWWLSEEAERKHSPSLSIDFWSRVLQQTGFSGLDCSVTDSQDLGNYSQSVLLSTAVGKELIAPIASIVMVYTGQRPPESWVRAVAHEIDSLSGSPLLLFSLSEAVRLVSDRICLLVDDRERPLLANIEETDFDALRTVLTNAKGALWLHYGGAMASPLPTAALVQGLLRVLRFENNAKRFVSLDMDPAAAPFSPTSSRNVGAVMRACFDMHQSQENVECEYAERDGIVFVPRLLEAVEESKAASSIKFLTMEPEMRPFKDAKREIVLEIGTPGALDTLRFVERFVPDHLDDDFVEIESKAFGLNFRDVMVAMGQLDSDKMGFECSGIVTRVGSAVRSVMRGDRVCALLRGDWATSNRVHESSVVKMPDSVSFETAASIPVVYVTAFYSLFTIGRLEQGESILIHAAAGGVGQAAVALAKLAGAKIYATAGSPEKREFLANELGIPADQVFSSRDAAFAERIMAATNGQGVDVILNSLSGDFMQSSWHCIAKFGRFVEIGKKDIEQSKRLDMNPFTRAASFTAVDLLHLGEERPLVVAKVMRSVFELLENGSVLPVKPVTVLPISQIGRAFRIMSQGLFIIQSNASETMLTDSQTGKHTGKIVIKSEPDDLVPVTIRQAALIGLIHSLTCVPGHPSASTDQVAIRRHVCCCWRTWWYWTLGLQDAVRSRCKTRAITVSLRRQTHIRRGLRPRAERIGVPCACAPMRHKLQG